MFLRNSWYVACLTEELGDTPVTATMLNEQIVLFRSDKGEVVALEDRCPHRHAPLHLGTVQGDSIRCGYHGMLISPAGRCIEVPSQTAIPPRAKIRAYPVCERWGWVWVWTGAPELADTVSVPDFSRMGDPNFPTVGDVTPVKAAYQLVNDNLMDLSHVGFVHTSTIGAAGMEKSRLTVEKTETGVRVTRLVENCTPPPTYVKTGLLPPGKNIDRWQVIDFLPPSFIIIHVGGAETGTGVMEGKFERGINFWVMNAMTPETETTTRYYWGNCRNFGAGVEALDNLVKSEVSFAFAEDKRMLEAQQVVISRHEDSWSNALQADAGSVAARRRLKQALDAEASASAAGGLELVRSTV